MIKHDRCRIREGFFAGKVQDPRPPKAFSVYVVLCDTFDANQQYISPCEDNRS